MKHIKALDALRTFAVLFVILSHWGPFFEATSLSGRVYHILVPNGGFGVVLFFVLSGYLISNILLKERYGVANRNNLHIVKNFVFRRSLRIFPIYYLLLYLLYLLNVADARQNIVYYLTYTTNIAVYLKHNWLGLLSYFWSLAVEEQFYLFWPWLVLFMPNKGLKYLFPVSVIAAVVFTGIMSYIVPPLSSTDPVRASILTPSCMVAFGLGGWLAYNRMYQKEKVQQFNKYLNLSALVMLILYLYNAVTGNYFVQHMLVTSVMCLWIVNYALVPKNTFFYKQVLENKYMIAIGKITYGIYIYHELILTPYYTGVLMVAQHYHWPLFNEVFNHPLVSYIIRVIILLVVAQLSFEFIEKPIMKLKKYFEYDKAEQIS